MELFKLRKPLQRCGAAEFTELVGEKRLVAIVSTLGGRATERRWQVLGFEGVAVEL